MIWNQCKVVKTKNKEIFLFLMFSYNVRPDSDGGGIQVSLKKKEPDWWPRLMYQPQKLSWLKVRRFL